MPNCLLASQHLIIVRDIAFAAIQNIQKNCVRACTNRNRLILIHLKDHFKPVLQLDDIGSAELVWESFVGKSLKPGNAWEAWTAERRVLVRHIAR